MIFFFLMSANCGLLQNFATTIQSYHLLFLSLSLSARLFFHVANRFSRELLLSPKIGNTHFHFFSGSIANPWTASKYLSLGFVGWAAHQTVFSAALLQIFTSDSEILAAVLQRVETTVVRTQRHRLDADKFPMFSVGGTWQGFCRDLDGLSRGLSP